MLSYTGTVYEVFINVLVTYSFIYFLTWSVQNFVGNPIILIHYWPQSVPDRKPRPIDWPIAYVGRKVDRYPIFRVPSPSVSLVEHRGPTVPPVPESGWDKPPGSLVVCRRKVVDDLTGLPWDRGVMGIGVSRRNSGFTSLQRVLHRKKSLNKILQILYILEKIYSY